MIRLGVRSMVRRFAQVPLFLFDFAEKGRLGQREHHDLFAGDRADVVVHAHNLDAGHLLHERFHYWPRCLDQLAPDLFDQISPFLSGE